MDAVNNPSNPRFYINLESDLDRLAAMSFPSPYIIFSKVKNILANYGMFLADDDVFLRMDDIEYPYFFQLTYPQQVENGNLYVTMEFSAAEVGFKVDINIMTEEELDEFIGDDEVEEI